MMVEKLLRKQQRVKRQGSFRHGLTARPKMIVKTSLIPPSSIYSDQSIPRNRQDFSIPVFFLYSLLS